MPKSDFIFDRGESITVERHGEHDYVYASGEEVTDAGESQLFYESGVGISGGEIIDWGENGTITFTVEGTSVEIFDTTYTGGGIFLEASNKNGTVTWDDIRKI